MFIAHLPAGYLIARQVRRWMCCGPAASGASHAVLLGGLIFSVLPDVDLVYATLIDHGQVHHHRYFTHWPLFWLACGLMWALRIAYTARRREWPLLLACLLSVEGHMALDWIAGWMWLLEPFSDARFQLIAVPARHAPWYLNFLWHWTAWIEVAITAVAAVCLWRDRRWRPLAGLP